MKETRFKQRLSESKRRGVSKGSRYIMNRERYTHKEERNWERERERE